jgi:hypothetical protein
MCLKNGILSNFDSMPDRAEQFTDKADFSGNSGGWHSESGLR